MLFPPYSFSEAHKITTITHLVFVEDVDNLVVRRQKQLRIDIAERLNGLRVSAVIVVDVPRQLPSPGRKILSTGSLSRPTTLLHGTSQI
jgi:hypothetical protein